MNEIHILYIYYSHKLYYNNGENKILYRTYEGDLLWKTI